MLKKRWIRLGEMIKRLFIYVFLCTLFLFSCKDESGPLPILGFQEEGKNGEVVYHTIRDWEYTNQDSLTVTNGQLKEFIYVSDFFFTSCPSICPRVTKEMLRVYETFKDDARVKLVSFTIDPKRDTPSRLKRYATNLEIDTDKWWFLTGDKDFTYELANDYFNVAMEDEEAPGGFDHSGKLILVDTKGHIRSFSEGTDPGETPKMIKDIKRLLGETYQ